MTTCVVCKIEVSKAADVATEYLIWDTKFGRIKETCTQRMAHILCLQGKKYLDKQMVIGEQE